jgi:LSD1 subclass zinc finger protein
MECGQCGARFAVPRGANTVQCAHCRGVTRVERHGAMHGAVGFARNLFGRRRPHPGYPPVDGNKRALLVGINYTGMQGELRGPVNDVKCMSFLLTFKYGFPSDSILVLTGNGIGIASPRTRIFPCIYTSNSCMPLCLLQMKSATRT